MQHPRTFPRSGSSDNLIGASFSADNITSIKKLGSLLISFNKIMCIQDNMNVIMLNKNAKI
jgi:hypothetical protein